MAIQKDSTTVHGFNAPEAYYRVEEVKLENKDKMSFFVQVYKSQESTDYAFNSFGYSCDYDINGANPIAQAYTHLKTLSEYSSATDV